MTQIQTLIDDLAARLQQPVQLDDRRFRAIAYSSHPDEIDAVRRTSILGRQAPERVTRWLEDLGVLRADGVVHVPRNAELQMMARACFPVRFHGRLLGLLWLLEDARPLAATEVAICRDSAAELAEELFRLEQTEDDERRREADWTLALLAGDARGAAGSPLATEALYGVILVDAATPQGERTPPGLMSRLMEAVDHLRRSVPPRHHLAAVQGTRATVIVTASDSAHLTRAADVLFEAARRALADTASAIPIVGVSDAVASVSDLPSAHQHAEIAARLGRGMPDLGGLVSWDGLGALRLLADLVGDRDPGPLLPLALRRLLRLPDGEMLVGTLEAYLEHAGNASTAAAELFLHRSSLYKRLHRVEEVAGVDLSSGSDRLELHLGVRLWRMAGSPSL